MSDSFSKTQVKHIAKLANLSLSENQIEEMKNQLNSIAEHMDTLKELDLSSLSETSRTTTEQNVWREDEVKKSLEQNEALKNAKNVHDGYFVAEYTLENKDE